MIEWNKKYKKEYITNRGIEKLYHFTRVENLSSILENGILPISELKKVDMKFLFNDTNRYDKLVDFTSFSVSFLITKCYIN